MRVILSIMCIFTLLAGLAGDARAEDFNDTYVHFLLTSGQNVKLELDRQRTFVSAIRFEVAMERLQQRMERLQKAMADSGLPNNIPVNSADGGPDVYAAAIAGLDEAIDLFNRNVDAMSAYRKAKTKQPSGKQKSRRRRSNDLREGDETTKQTIDQLNDRLKTVLDDFRHSAGQITDFQPMALAFLYHAAVLDCADSPEAEFALQSAYVLKPDLVAPKPILKILGKTCREMAKKKKSGKAALQVETIPAAATVTINGKPYPAPVMQKNLPEGTYIVRIEAAGQQPLFLAVPVIGGGRKLSVVLQAEGFELASRATPSYLELEDDEDTESFTSLFFRLDYFPPKDAANTTVDIAYTLAMLGLQTKTWDFNGFCLDFHGGFSTFIIMTKQKNVADADYETQLAFWNFLFGTTMGYKSYIRLGADVSLNAVTFHGANEGKEAVYDFDQANFYASSPFLGVFGSLRYSLGSKQPRDLELGYAYSFRKYGLGVLTAAYSARFDYEITGLIVNNDRRRIQTIAGDHSGTVRWERVRPGGQRFWEFSLGLSLGNVTDAARFAYLENGLYISRKYMLYVRGSNSWSRVERERYWGGAGGLEMPLASDVVFLRAQVGYRDYENVDRYGDPGLLIGTISFSGAF